MIKKSGSEQALRYSLYSVGGAIPVVGGLVSGAGSILGEKKQQKINEKITEWASNNNEDVKQLRAQLATQLQEPTKAHMVLLLAEVTNQEPPDTPSETEEWNIPLILHGETHNELRAYETQGWLTLKPNGNVTNMGAGNRIGSSIEDNKRPWGMGNGYILTISNSFYEEKI